MLGPKETITLQEPTETRTSTGSVSKSWSTVTTAPAVIDRSWGITEKVRYDKETVFADVRIMIDRNDINAAYHPSLIEKNRMQIDSINYDIKGVVAHGSGYLGSHFEIFLERVK